MNTRNHIFFYTASFNQFNLIIFILIISFISCNHYDSIQTGGRESTENGRSHHSGEDCMNCHHDPSNGASSSGYWWYIAGTAYNNDGSIAKSGTVEFWSALDSTTTLVHSLPVDRNGNFYTSKIIDFKGGIYPKVISTSGSLLSDTIMVQAVTFSNASCNSCHGHNYDGRNQPHVTFK